MEENKTKAMRLSDENVEWWNSFVSELKGKLNVSNLSQNDAFTEMRKAVEVAGVKSRVPGKKEDVDEFRTMLDQLLTKYLSAVDSLTVARLDAEEKVKNDLKSKDNVIFLLQERNKSIIASLDDTNKENKTLKDMVSVWEEQNKSLKKVIENKDEVIKAKNDRIKDLEERLVKSEESSTTMSNDMRELKELIKGMHMQADKSVKE